MHYPYIVRNVSFIVNSMPEWDAVAGWAEATAGLRAEATAGLRAEATAGL